MTKRLDARHDYRHFPRQYADLLAIFASQHSVRYGPWPKATCLAMRRDLYRYWGFLRNADPSDEYARSLSDIACTIVCRVVPASSTQATEDRPAPSEPTPYHEQDYWLELSLNPIVRDGHSPHSSGMHHTPTPKEPTP